MHAVFSPLEASHAAAVAGVTVVVADDHPAMLASIAGILARNGFEVVGQAGDGQQALAQIEATNPDLALVDVRMPRMSGIEVAREAAVVAPDTAIVVYTAYGDLAILSEALDAGVRGFVLKEAPLADLVRALERVVRGEAYIDPVLAGALVNGRADQVASLRERATSIRCWPARWRRSCRS